MLTKNVKNRILFLIFIFLLSVIVIFFIIKSLNKNILYFSSPSEIKNREDIPFGKAICGQVAVSNENFVVSDVNSQDNYIACSLRVRSEIVIPLFVNNINIGQIDIDSNTIDPFTQEDERFLEFVCESVASIM